MPLLPPGAAQGMLAGFQDIQQAAANKQLEAIRALQIQQAQQQMQQQRRQQAQELATQQALGSTFSNLYPQPPAPGQPSAPYKTVQSAGAPPPVQQPQPQRMTAQGVIQAVTKSLQQNNVPQEMWGAAYMQALNQLKPLMDMQNQQDAENFKRQLAVMGLQMKAKDQAERERRDNAYISHMDAMVSKLKSGGEDFGGQGDMLGQAMSMYDRMPDNEKKIIDGYAQRANLGDYSWRTGLARSKYGQQLMLMVDARAPMLLQEGGQAQTAPIVSGSTLKATQGALSQLTKDISAIKPFQVMLDKNSDILLNLADKAIKSDSRIANRSLNWLSQNMGDNPDVAEYLAQMEFVKTEAARVLNNPRLAGQLSDTARQEMASVIDGNMPINATRRVIQRIKADGTNRVSAMEKQQQDLLQQMRSTAQMTPQPRKSGLPAGWSVEVQ